MVFLIRAMFGKALKTNDALAFAVLTGCLRVSKESIFTGLNNFKILSITDTRFDEQFGFTDAEVQKLLSDYHLENRFREVKEWYDGYRFGKADVYCPWDVINFVDRAKDDPEAKPEAYWINTSGNDLVKRFIDKAHKTTKNEIERLIAGEVIENELRLDLTYEEIDQSIENLWSVLFTTGYLTQVGRTEEGAYRLVIPNREVREVFRLQINEWFKRSIFSNAERLTTFWKPEGDSMALTKPYILVGGIVLFVALLFFFTKLPEIKPEEEKEVTAIVEEKPAASIWKRRQFVRSVVAQFCYCAAQTGIFGFFINYVTEMDPGISNLRASRILAFGGMALFMIGRLSVSFTMKWLAPGRLLTWYSLLSAVCMALVVASVGTLSLYALYLSFFFMSIMFPTIFALGLEGMGVYTKKASSYIVMGVAGGAFSPMLMGYIGEENMALGFIVPLIAFLYILYFAIKCKR